jgi:hypothetical protein
VAPATNLIRIRKLKAGDGVVQDNSSQPPPPDDKIHSIIIKLLKSGYSSFEKEEN